MAPEGEDRCIWGVAGKLQQESNSFFVLEAEGNWESTTCHEGLEPWNECRHKNINLFKISKHPVKQTWLRWKPSNRNQPRFQECLSGGLGWDIRSQAAEPSGLILRRVSKKALAGRASSALDEEGDPFPSSLSSFMFSVQWYFSPYTLN